MKAPLLALFERSLRQESRSWLPLIARLLLLGWLLLQLVFIATQARRGWLGAPGLYFFQHIAWLNFVVLTMGGLGYFAAAIAEEKEEMTLGLLRMTGLNPLAILLGKSTARLTGAMLLLLVQLPFTLLAVTLGGIGVPQIIAAYAVLLAYLFLLSNLALIWSVVCQRIATAAAWTGLCLFLFLAVPHWILALLSNSHTTSFGAWVGGSDHGVGWLLARGCEMLMAASPAVRLTEVFRTGTIVTPWNFQVASNLAAGVVCFGIAWLLFDRCTRDIQEAAPVRTLEMRLRSWWRRGRVPTRITGAQALTWKESGLYAGGAGAMALRVLVLGLLYVAVFCVPMWLSGASIRRDYLGGSLMIFALVLLAVMLAFGAANIFHEEVQWKTLSSLVILPISVLELIGRKVVGRLIEVVPALGFLVVGAGIYPAGVHDFVRNLSRDGTAFLAFLFFIAQYLLFLHLVAYLSLIVKRWALPLAFVLQYGCGSMCVILFGVSGILDNHNSADGLLMLSILVTSALLFCLLQGMVARLRRAAAEE